MAAMSFGLSRGKEFEFEGYGFLQQNLPPFDDGRLDPRTHFGFTNPSQPFHIEIGSGKGTFLTQQAQVTPNTNYLGIEWAAEFFRYAADRVRRHHFDNVRLLNADAIEFIRFWLPSEICEVLHIYFPDPWPKKRHQKRRSFQEDNLVEFHRLISPGGEIRVVTDHADYFTWMEDHADRVKALFERADFDGADSANEGEIVGTNFERKYRREGRPFQAMRLLKK